MPDDESTDNVRVIPFTKANWNLLPPRAGVCPICATNHTPDQPHNQQSLHYQYGFYLNYQRWPTWADAMRHCTDEVKQRWINELAKKGIVVE